MNKLIFLLPMFFICSYDFKNDSYNRSILDISDNLIIEDNSISGIISKEKLYELMCLESENPTFTDEDVNLFITKMISKFDGGKQYEGVKDGALGTFQVRVTTTISNPGTIAYDSETGNSNQSLYAYVHMQEEGSIGPNLSASAQVYHTTFYPPVVLDGDYIAPGTLNCGSYDAEITASATWISNTPSAWVSAGCDD